MILTLDIGNTRSKFALFDDSDIVCHLPVSHERTLSTLSDFFSRHRTISAVHWCSVGVEIEGFESALAAMSVPVRRLLPASPPPGITVAYLTPDTLGADRLAAVLGARSLCPDRHLLVIDAGTCITFDLLLADGRYMGGNISPGLAMRLEAMHRLTARLPLVNADGETPLMGQTTETALRSGATLGIVYEIEGYIRRLQAEYGDICVFLTGGNRFDFRISSESCIFADDFLVLRGLAALG